MCRISDGFSYCQFAALQYLTSDDAELVDCCLSILLRLVVGNYKRSVCLPLSALLRLEKTGFLMKKPRFGGVVCFLVASTVLPRSWHKKWRKEKMDLYIGLEDSHWQC